MSCRWTEVFLALCVACGPAVPEGEPLPTTAPLEGCDTPLSLSVPFDAVPTHGVLRVEASGGSGSVQFALDPGPSGALIQSNGTYFAGDVADVLDDVVATDVACAMQATVRIWVVPPWEVRPRTARVRPRAQFEIESSGGSGEVRCESVRLGSGTLDGCVWQAGASAGVDEIDVIDERTGERQRVAYTVDPAAEFRMWGRRLLLPVGQPFAPTWTAGTGELEILGDVPLQYESGTLTATREGTFHVEIRDRFVPGFTATVPVHVAEPRAVAPVLDGERGYWADVVAADLNQDGLSDVVVGWPEGSAGAHYSGAVAIYPGREGGPDASPAWVVSAPQQYAYTGREVAVGDLNADGLPDVVVGSHGWNGDAGSDMGRVDLYFGVPGGWPSSEPDQTLFGEFAGDNLGSAVEICDLSGDGHDDLVVAGYGIEDRSVSPSRSAEGGIHVWRGGPQGVFGEPVWRLYSENGGALMGRRMASGDTDGDGRCDLVTSSYAATLDGSGSDGVMWQFTSAAVLAGETGPQRRYTSDLDDASIHFGRSLALADVDGDQRDDVIAGGWYADTVATQSGGVWVFLEADHRGQGVWPTSQASATLEPIRAYDYLGLSLGVADDVLWVGAGQAEVPGSTNDLGTVHAYPFDALRGTVGPDLRAADHEGTSRYSFFGQAVADAGDVDGDGRPDLAVVATRDPAFGIDAGALHVISATGARTLHPLPDAPSGDHLGDRNAAALVDVDGDGWVELLGGAWGRPSATSYNAGAAYRWAGTAAGIDRSAPSMEYVGLPLQAGGDRMGVSVAMAGDFDGDGRDDHVVVGQYGDRPSSYSTTEYANPDECPGIAYSIGVAWVYLGDAKSPGFLVHGLAQYDRLDMATGGLDHDGDGYDDLVVGSAAYGTEGGFSIAYGRPADDQGRIVVVCDPVHTVGVSVGSLLGDAAAGIGDLDGDGCDELAVGAAADDLGRTNQGAVRVMWGHGPACASPDPEVTTLVSGRAYDRVGYALAGGRDVDGDGVPDLVVSALDADTGSGDLGAVWLASGAWVAGLTRQRASPLPGAADTIAHVLRSTGRVDGTVVNGDFGSGLALVAAPDDPTGTWLMVGHARGGVGGRAGTGGAVAFAWGPDGFEAEPAALVGGEFLDGRLGAVVRARGGVVAVGAPLSDAIGLDSGAIYPFVLR